MKLLSRRSFFGTATALAAAATVPAAANTHSHARPSRLFDILRIPDRIQAFSAPTTGSSAADAVTSLNPQGPRWQASGIEVRTELAAYSLAILVTAPTTPLCRIHLRWSLSVEPALLFLGDAWERSYGDLAWRSMVPERVLPWYFATHDGGSGTTNGYGVLTGASAFAFWQVDPAGVSLWLDVSNGGSGVLLGQRQLHAATVICRAGNAGEHPTDAIAALCKLLCPAPRLPKGPVYGTNDWYYAYGNNTEAGILRDTALVASLAPKSVSRPFSVIDMGWEANPTFPDMPRLAEKIRALNVRPGIWIRPTLAPTGTRPGLLLPQKHFKSPGSDLAYDITLPEALAAAVAKLTQVVDWKYELVKHDFSTFDLLGQWGFEMGATPTVPGWSFHDRSRTNAEIILDYYKALRSAAGEQTILLGCNTISHLAAGVFEMQRTGDDTSGKIWERTRRMGINTLAFRLPQNNTFYALDADCVGITKSIPWELNRQWMDLLARSGTGLFLSPSPDAIGPEQRAAIAEAFAIAAATSETVSISARPTDALRNSTPQAWEFKSATQPTFTPRTYNWFPPEGTDPYPI